MALTPPFLALLLAMVAVPAWGAPSPEDMVARCQAGLSSRFKSPSEIFKARGLEITNACPFQTQVDKAHECQDAATVLQNMYDILQEYRGKTCAAAQQAVNESKRDCQDQASCVAAQKAALDKFRGLLRDEIDLLRDYATQADLSMGYAIEAIAGGGVFLLKELKRDHAAADDGTNKFGPNGVDGTTRFLQARNNDDAIKRVFRNEDERRAAEIVQKFKDGKGTPSDITGIKSDLIREPLSVAAAGLDWKKQVQSYQRDLESQLGLMGHDSARLGTNGKNMGTVQPQPAPKDSTISRASDKLAPPPAKGTASAAPAGNLGRALDGLNGLAKAASSVAPMLAGRNGNASDVKDEEPAPASALPTLGLGGDMKSPLSSPDASASAVAPSPDGSAKGASPGGPENIRVGSGLALGGPGLAGPFGRAGASRAGKAASRTAGPASAKAAGGAGALGGGAPAAPGVDSSPGGEGQAANEESRAVAGGAGGAEDLRFGGSVSGGASAAESNEKAVQGIVGDWEKALNPEAADSGGVPVAGAEIAGGESPSLFSRVRVAHERALKRGSLARVSHTRL